uniref:Uncharacterized protein n=1 Tax=Cryptomonas curvata TaxID=233186 RepID=A0A7S0M7N6_9CRYP
MVETFGAQFETARVEGVFLGRGSGQKFRLKWTNLLQELKFEYGANHGVFHDPSQDRPQKQRKIHGPQPVASSAERSSRAVSNEIDGLELHPSSPEDSDSEDADPQIPGINSLQIGENQWRLDPALDTQDPRIGGSIWTRHAQIRFPPYLVEFTNVNVDDESDHVTEAEMMRCIGIIYVMTVSPLSAGRKGNNVETGRKERKQCRNRPMQTTVRNRLLLVHCD